MKYRFYNRDGHWYIDLPKYIQEGGSEADLEMVVGAVVSYADFKSGNIVNNYQIF